MEKNSTKRSSNGRKSKSSHKRSKKMKFILFLECLLLLVLIPVVFIVYQFSRIPTYDMNMEDISINQLNNQDMKDYRNIVIFGVDSRANELTKNTRSDSIMVASIHKKTKDIKIVSIYRDTYINIKDHGYTKINHAYSYGGPELAISTINQNLDLNITDFVTVNFSALTNVIDALGGVSIDITEAELDYVNKYIKDVAKINGTKCVYLKKPGKQMLSGTQATAYCRVRYTKGGDFTRAQRQRTVLQQIVKQAKSAKLTTLLPLINEMIPQIYTSLSTSEIAGLATGIFSYSVAGETGFPFKNTPRTINKASVVVPNTLTSNVTELHSFLFGTENYHPSEMVQQFSSEIAAR